MIRTVSRSRRALLVLAVALALLAGACTRSASEVEVSANGGGSSTGAVASGKSAVPSGSGGGDEEAAAPANRLDAGSFGDLEDVCQDGKPSGSPDKGVTATEINVGTVTDKGSDIRPGLNKDMWDSAVAFTKWCNERGGINGRKLSLTDLDAKLMEYPTAVTKGCQTDFAMVGGGAALDNGDGGARVKCGLVNIAGYAVSQTARKDKLQVFPVPAADDKVMAGAFRVLAEQDPKAAKKLGFLTGDLQSIVISKDQDREYAENHGYKTVYDQRYGVAGESNWRPFVEDMKSKGVEVLELTGEPSALIGLQKAMKTVGWYPKYTMQQTNFYDPRFVAEGGSTAKDTYVRGIFYPTELAKDNPATADYLELMERYNPKGQTGLLGMQGLSAWLLFAKAAKECGNDLTRDCLLEKAQAVTSWTGGGLHAETGPGNDKMPDCFTVLKVTPDGFVFDKELTQPTDGIYNCDPENIGPVTPPPAE
jgi:ABC-type branched-subunit amino acid transport system substrate-binding protein